MPPKYRLENIMEKIRFIQLSPGPEEELDLRPIDWSLCFICQKDGESGSNELIEPSKIIGNNLI